jgi:hypothetical protein
MSFSNLRSSAGSHSHVKQKKNFIDDVDMISSMEDLSSSRISYKTPSSHNNRIISTAGSTISMSGSARFNSFSNISNAVVNVVSEEIIETKLHPEERKFHDILQKQSILNNKDIQGNFSLSIFPDGKK